MGGKGGNGGIIKKTALKRLLVPECLFTASIGVLQFKLILNKCFSNLKNLFVKLNATQVQLMSNQSFVEFFSLS